MFAGKYLFFNFSLELSVLEPKKNIFNPLQYQKSYFVASLAF